MAPTQHTTSFLAVTRRFRLVSRSVSMTSSTAPCPILSLCEARRLPLRTAPRTATLFQPPSFVLQARRPRSVHRLPRRASRPTCRNLTPTTFTSSNPDRPQRRPRCMPLTLRASLLIGPQHPSLRPSRIEPRSPPDGRVALGGRLVISNVGETLSSLGQVRPPTSATDLRTRPIRQTAT